MIAFIVSHVFVKIRASEYLDIQSIFLLLLSALSFDHASDKKSEFSEVPMNVSNPFTIARRLASAASSSVELLSSLWIRLLF